MTCCKRVPIFLLLLLVLSGCSGGSSDSDVSFQDQIAMALEETSPDFRARSLVAIAEEQFGAHDSAGAAETMRLAKKACEEIPADDHLTRADIFLFLANAQNQIDKRSDANRSLETAKSEATAIEDPMLQAKTLASIGGFQGLLGEVDSGVQSLKKAEELAGQLKDSEGTENLVGKTQILVATAKGYDKLGKAEEVERVFGDALEAANASTDARDRCDGIASVAMAQHDLGRETAAEVSFDSALESARAIDDVLSKAHALAEMAERFSAADKHTQAHSILEEADQVAHQIGEPDLQQQTIDKVRTLMGTLPKPSGSSS